MDLQPKQRPTRLPKGGSGGSGNDPFAQTMEALRIATREAREVLSDLLDAERRISERVKAIESNIDLRVEKLISRQVEDGLKQYIDQVTQAQREAEKRIMASFDDLADTLLGRKKGMEPLEKLARDAIARRITKGT